MRTSHFIALSVSSLALLDGVAAQRSQRSRQAGASTTTAAAASTTPAAVANANPAANAAGATLIAGGQPNSNSNGNPTAGQAPSLTDPENFINFCQGKTATNGLQNTAGSCNPIPMGDLPAKAKMISTVITNPVNGANIAAANTPFDITLTTTNLQAGQFTNPNVAYYTAPQHLNAQGQIIGHVHVTVQNMGADINNPIPPDPTTFAFFKGIDDAGDGQGHLKAVVTAGLPAGNYRICTLVAAANHQPVTMPVAQRGAQDDCVRITVGGAGTGAAAAGAAGAASTSAATTAAAAAGATTPVAAATTSSAAGNAAGKALTDGAKQIISGAKGKSSAATQANTTTAAATAATATTAATTAATTPAATAAASASASTSPAAVQGGRPGTGRGRGGRSRLAKKLSDEKDDEVVRERFIAREFIV